MFGSIISSLVTNAVKTTVKSSLRIDELVDKLKENCPSNQELEKIINQKNQLSETLGLVQTNFNTLNSITGTVDNIIPPINTVVTFIKTIPLPASFPPGIGVPINLITKLSDTLETLKDLIQQGRVSLKGAKQASRVISSNIGKVQSKLNQLDAAVFLCANQTGYTGDISNGTSGITSNPIINVNLNEQLEGRLSSNSTNPLIYKGWRLILQTDPNNTFSFPRRRVIAQKSSSNNNGVQTLISNFGPPGSEWYSYSSNTQVLVDDIKFKIDNPNWRPDSVIESLNEVEAAAEAAAAAAAEAAAEAARQAEELRRGKVVFFGQTGALANIPLGDFGGYGEGEYPFTGAIDGLRPEQSSERISSVRVGRGMRVTLFYNSDFLTKPGIPENDPNIQNLSRRVFEHPFDAPTDYVEAYVGDEFNDNVNSFIIDKLPGGTTRENPPERLAIYTPTWVLKQRSIKELYGLEFNPSLPNQQPSLGNLKESAVRYDGYVIDSPSFVDLYVSLSPLSEEEKQRLIYSRASTENEAIDKVTEAFNIPWFSRWNFSSSDNPGNVHTIRYKQKATLVGQNWNISTPSSYYNNSIPPQNNKWRKLPQGNYVFPQDTIDPPSVGGEYYFEKLS